MNPHPIYFLLKWDTQRLYLLLTEGNEIIYIKRTNLDKIKYCYPQKETEVKWFLTFGTVYALKPPFAVLCWEKNLEMIKQP